MRVLFRKFTGIKQNAKAVNANSQSSTERGEREWKRKTGKMCEKKGDECA